MSRREELAANLAAVRARIDDACAAAGRAPGSVDLVVVTKFFPATGVRLLAGRRFGRETTPVAIVNHACVRRYWGADAPPAAAIGRRVRAGEGEWLEIIGVAADARQRLDLPPFPEIIRPYTQGARSSMSLILRAANSPAAVAQAVRREVRALDPDVPVAGPADMDGGRSMNPGAPGIPQRPRPAEIRVAG